MRLERVLRGNATCKTSAEARGLGQRAFGGEAPQTEGGGATATLEGGQGPSLRGPGHPKVELLQTCLHPGIPCGKTPHRPSGCQGYYACQIPSSFIGGEGGGAETFKQASLPVFTDPKTLRKEVTEKLHQSLKQLHTSHCAKASEAVGI